MPTKRDWEKARDFAKSVMAADDEQLSWFGAGAHYAAIITILVTAKTLMGEIPIDEAFRMMREAHDAVDKQDAETIAKDLLEYALYSEKRIPLTDDMQMANLIRNFIGAWSE